MSKPIPRARVRCLLIPTAVFLALVLWSVPSPLMVKKVVGFLVMPTGVIWLGLLALVASPGLGGWGRRLAALVLVLYTLAGNVWLGAWLLARLEAPYASMSRPTERFDAIFVLGGGSSTRPDGGSQLGASGDRLIIPARLFLAGKAGHLVASGMNVTSAGGPRSLADETALLWMDLGIPETSITRLSEPRTTKEEIRAYKKLLEQRTWRRVGVCSSAWHLRRVEGICRREGLTMVPVPADFLSSSVPWLPIHVVPQSNGFQNVQRALWEYLGAITGG